MSTREPLLQTVPIAELRPTQVTVGFREVAEKRRDWSERPDGDRAEWLGRHMIPVLLGPKKRPYVIDHHHLTRALLEEGCAGVLVNVVADLSMLDRDAFWVFADNRGWCHPYDAEGRRAGFDDIPKSIADLADDPFRSLAGALRRAGGYAKETVPFTEFMWADALRRRIKRREVDASFSGALLQALEFAKSRDARYLPGWCGPNDGT
ncbi:ParB-like protein [Lichenibacterium ramalinae]|uniref:Chromosome partitioning protein ParB n=1 Tax=Lichenibacterium ramalinae TaxID=2316527 RepID=A0A4Q2RH18_9HYPH|nr:ParB-like protein [Lichenibacterium ramalinae]RYB07769.1 chromosome partitioning protein ParB [Lichenibacterium ramalinae]